MKKSALHPRSRKTPRGGRMMARMILQISLDDVCQLCASQKSGQKLAEGEYSRCGKRHVDGVER